MANADDTHLEGIFHNLEAVVVHGGRNTRKIVFSPYIQPLLDAARRGESEEVCSRHVMETVLGLHSLGIFSNVFPGDVYKYNTIGSKPAFQTSRYALDIHVREIFSTRAKFNTDLGNGEGSASAEVVRRNLFGAAETLSINYSAGTRTRSAYSATLGIPLPWLLPRRRRDLRAAVSGFTSTSARPWAGCDEISRGGFARMHWGSGRVAEGLPPPFAAMLRSGGAHTLEYAGVWRQVTSLDKGASPSLRREAGDSVKSSLRYSYVLDRRDSASVPSVGHVFKSAVEVAGIGPLGGDVGFSKTEVEAGGARTLFLEQPRDSSQGLSRMGMGMGMGPLPSQSRPRTQRSMFSAVTLTYGARTGLICPLPVGFSSAGAEPSRFSDRFQLGGPNDVRGFYLGGLGPHDGKDALGGDLFAAANLGLLLPLPYRPIDSPFRIQLYANSGRLVALGGDPRGRSVDGKLGVREVGSAVARAARELFSGPPSVAVGFGLVYAHSDARFELNFGVPLVTRKGERASKGFQLGFGVDFL